MQASSQTIKQNAGRKTGSNRLLFSYTAIAAAVAFTLGGITAIAKTNPSLPETSPLVIEESVVKAPSSFASLIQSVQPAVVNITVAGKVTSMSGTEMPNLSLPNNPNFNDFFERFFQQRPGSGEHKHAHKLQGVGSGFIVTPDGYIVTSNHVVENASEIQVVLDDGKRLPAVVHGIDPKTDLALLKIDTDSELPYVVFGDSDSAQTGDWIVAIGNPFGLGGTATTGIISARGRDINSGPYDDYLQIDAPINRGNSGGPLFGLNGKVLGVNTAIFSPNGANVGIGFAVPASQAKSVINQLIQHGHVQRGWLGVQIQGLNQALADSLDLSESKGALVADVTAGSPAAQGGVQVGDVILRFNAQDIQDMRDLPRLVADVRPGEKISLTVWRQGKRQDLAVSIATYPNETLAAAEIVPPVAQGARLGVTLAPITDALRQQMDIAKGVEGALVVEVEAGSPAAQEGLRAGDVIVQAESKPVYTPQDVVSVVQATNASERKRILLLINRQGDQRFVTVQLG